MTRFHFVLVIGVTLLLLLSLPLWAVNGEDGTPVQTLHLWAKVQGQQTVGIVCHDGALDMLESKAPNTGIAWCLEPRPNQTIPYGLETSPEPEENRLFLPLVSFDG